MMETIVNVKYCVIGAGHGGQALAAYLRYMGNTTVIYNRTKTVIDQIKAFGGIELQGVINAMVKGVYATSNLKDAIDRSDVIMICIPAHAHQDIAMKIAPYLKPRHKIVINPGRTLGAYMFTKYLKEAGMNLDIPIAETDTFILTSRKTRPGVSQVFSRKNLVRVSGMTTAHTKAIHDCLSHTFPMMVAAESVLITSLSNIGMIFHPFPALMNIGRIECKETYLHYKDGITPSIAKFLEKLDRERVQLAEYFGYKLHNAQEWLEDVYGASGSNLYDALQKTTQYDQISSPADINTRYVFEDIPTGIVPFLELAKLAGTPHKYLQLVLDLANEMYSIDFKEIGRSEVSDFFEMFKPKDKEELT
jgi:opine dehydrogenase